MNQKIVILTSLLLSEQYKTKNKSSNMTKEQAEKYCKEEIYKKIKK